MNKNKIIFDQYSRYQACADLMVQAGVDESGSILDIGCGPEMLFRDFLPGVKMSFVDPLIPEGTPNAITGNVFSPELNEVNFETVCAVDVLEHVPPEHREKFIRKMSSLATDFIVLGFPTSDSSDAAEVDASIENLYRKIHDKDYSWLEEHFRYGLPSLNTTVDQLEGLGWNCQTIGHGYAPWLEEMLGFVINVWGLPKMNEVVLNISERFNRELYQFDFGASCYRQFIVASRKKIPALMMPDEANNNDKAQSIFREIMEDAKQQYFVASMQMLSEKGFDELQGIIQERDSLSAERDNVIADCNKHIETIAQMKNGMTWRLTKPFRFIGRLYRYGLCAEDKRRISKAVRVRYHKLPLPVMFKKFLSYFYHNISKKLIYKVKKIIFSESKFVLPEFEPQKQTPDKVDYIIWGVVDWHFRHQRPQHIALALANKGHRVFYISPVLVHENYSGFNVEEIGDTGKLFQISMYANGSPSIYKFAANTDDSARLRLSAGEVLDWANIKQLISLVQHPFWFDVANTLPNSRLVYDCMDHHAGFNNTGKELLQLENNLLSHADLTITTSEWLDKTVESFTTRQVLIRNAGEYKHFSEVPENIYADPDGKKIIGYYGAIADWFDVSLVELIAEKFPEFTILLIGADTINAKSKLAKKSNVKFIGEVGYNKLPEYLHSFEVCLLPFKVMPLTMATNPVKVYEYLSAGKPVVSVDLPEMHQFGGLVNIAQNEEDFVEVLQKVIEQQDGSEAVQQRKTFAKNQTWEIRVDELITEVSGLAEYDPKVSVIVVTYNNIELTRACLESIEKYSDYANLEVIVVDNDSSDGSKDFIQSWVEKDASRKAILNDDNKGFSAANNQGLSIATGDYLVLLNNDTYVTPGWVRTLTAHLKRDSSIGLVGPVTNNIGNEAKIDIHYNSMNEMISKSAEYTRRHCGEVYKLNTAAFFCVMFSRDVYQKVGTLDEVYGIGFFEDDDYCRRIERLGLKVVCAEDVFVHHNLSASFDKLKNSFRMELFDKNKKIYEEKWGAWEPHKFRK